MSPNHYFINVPEAQTRREPGQLFFSHKVFSEPRLPVASSESVIHEIYHPFSFDTIIDRQVALRDEEKQFGIRESPSVESKVRKRNSRNSQGKHLYCCSWSIWLLSLSRIQTPGSRETTWGHIGKPLAEPAAWRKDEDSGTGRLLFSRVTKFVFTKHQSSNIPAQTASGWYKSGTDFIQEQVGKSKGNDHITIRWD